MIKKERIMGREITLSLNPLQTIQNFFDTSPSEVPSIPMGTKEYRKYVLRVKSKKEKWGSVTTGLEKEKLANKRFASNGRKE